MPELPEVETIRRDLWPILCRRTIVGARWDRKDRRFSKLGQVRGRRVRSVNRRGKYILVGLGSIELIVHLGMSGRLFVTDRTQEVAHCRVVLLLSGGLRLVFADRRRFGIMHAVASGDYRALPTLAFMGPEPLSPAFDLEEFTLAVQAPRSTIKSLLLSQRVVAGLGNIYSDEALHRSLIHPATRGLDAVDARRLHRQIRRVLSEAIAHRGTSFSLFRDGILREGDFLKKVRVFGRQGQPCRRCRTAIVKVVQAGRGTHFCPTCQPMD